MKAPRCPCGAPVVAPELPEEGVDLERFLDGLAWTLTDQALARAGGNRSQAARLLRIERTTLVERLRALGRRGAAP